MRALILALGLILPPCPGREVLVSVWISGGAEGLLAGGRVAPGWLGLIEQRNGHPDDPVWVDVGGTRHFPGLLEISGVEGPDAVIPGESLLRLRGVGFLQTVDVPWVIGNGGVLPQFPDVEPAWARVRVLRLPDGGRVRITSALSETAPLRVPASRLRPLWVRSPVDQIRERYIESSLSPAEVFDVLVIPEGADGGEWSRRFPEVDVVVEPATGAPAMVEVRQGAGLRVKPGRFGRSVIRAWARWDTVTRSFSRPFAEVEWVRSPKLRELVPPDRLTSAARTLPTDAEVRARREGADAVWTPRMESVRELTRIPDALRAQRVPDDDAWARVELSPGEWTRWRNEGGDHWEIPAPESFPRSPAVLLPAKILAGNGDLDSEIRTDVLNGEVTVRWTPWTTRDFVQREEAP